LNLYLILELLRAGYLEKSVVDITYTVSPVALTNLINDKDVCQESDTVVIDIRFNNSGEVSRRCCQQVDKALRPRDIRPTTDIALSIVVPSHSNHGAIGL
jgi:hypothetical protein